MKLKKGLILVFKDREETIIQASNNILTGTIKTNNNTYSTDFINRWIEYGFIKVKGHTITKTHLICG